jgi:hypothetical protein
MTRFLPMEMQWKRSNEKLGMTRFLPMEMQRKKNNEKLGNGCKRHDSYQWKCNGKGVTKN